MRNLALTVIAASLLLSQVQSKKPAAKAKVPETSHLVFVTEYIRELSAYEEIRSAAQEELKQDTTDNDTLSTNVHSSTLFQLELGSEVRMLRGMHLNPPLDYLIPGITKFDEQKVVLWRRLSHISSALLEGPKPGVDYSEFLAEVPKVRANLDYIDQALFEATSGVFATLIDLKPDSKGHTSHLIITKSERQKLISDLNTDFGSKLDQKNQDYTVSAASVLRAYLLKDFKCSDEPWD